MSIVASASSTTRSPGSLRRARSRRSPSAERTPAASVEQAAFGELTLSLATRSSSCWSRRSTEVGSGCSWRLDGRLVAPCRRLGEQVRPALLALAGRFGSRWTSARSSRRRGTTRRLHRRRRGAGARNGSSAPERSAVRAATAPRGSRPVEGSRSSASAKSWRYFAVRGPGAGREPRVPFAPRLCAAARTSDSSSSRTGSRFVAWLQASRSEFSVSGYCSGVVRCFSIRQPRTRSSAGSRRWMSRVEDRTCESIAA